MPWHLLLLVAPLFFTAPVAAWLIYYLYRRHGMYDFPLMLLIAAASIWATGYGFELTVSSFEAKMWLACIEYIGIFASPVAWLLIGLQLNGQLARLKPWMIGLLLALPFVSLVQVFMWQAGWTFFWTHKGMIRYDSINVLSNTFGPGLWAQIIYSYLLQLAGGWLILLSAVRTSGLYMRQRIALVMALVLPWIANAVYVFKLTASPLDFTPLFIVVSAVLLFIGVLRYRLGDLIPVAREKIFSEMHDGVLLFDDRNRLIDANKAGLRLLGIDAAAIGKTAESIFARHKQLMKLFDAGNASPAELLYSGFEHRVVRITADQMGRANELPCRLLVFNDLSIGNRIETTLRLVVESTSADVGEDFFRSVTRSLALALGAKHAFIGRFDEEREGSVTTMAFWSDGRFLDNFNYPLAGSPCENLLSTRTCVYVDNVQEEFPVDKALVRLGVTSYVGTRLTGFDQSHLGVFVVMNDKPFRSPEATASVLEVFAVRVAAELERQHTDAMLQESEARYRRIVETTRDGLCVLNAAGNIEFLNDPMAALIGRGKQELVGQPLHDQFYIIANEQEPLSFENDTVEVQLVRGDGRKIWTVISKTIIPGPNGEPIGALMMFTDITESKLLVEQNAHIELQLQHAQKLESLGVLAGGIAHDFNNLLIPILGYLDLIQERVRSDGLATEYLSRMRDAGGKLADLCNQMLTYSGKGQFVTRQLDLNELLGRLADLIRASTAKSLHIEYRLDSRIGKVRGDETQLDQIVINLVINASEAMSHRPDGTIVISTGEQYLDAGALATLSNGEALAPGHYIYMEVSDEGSGIAEQDVIRLFEPFFTTKFTGRGLGMAVVFGIVKSHHGAIRVISIPDTGTRIRIYLPLDTGTVSEPGPAPQQRGVGQGRGAVLVVDDEELVRRTLGHMLEAAGFDVITANDGVQGFETFEREHERLSACVIDVTMPGMNGYSLVEKMRSLGHDTPVVLVSGFSATEFDDHRVEQSNITFLQKPFDSGELLQTVLRVSSGRQTDPSLH